MSAAGASLPNETWHERTDLTLPDGRHSRLCVRFVVRAPASGASPAALPGSNPAMDASPSAAAGSQAVGIENSRCDGTGEAKSVLPKRPRLAEKPSGELGNSVLLEGSGAGWGKCGRNRISGSIGRQEGRGHRSTRRSVSLTVSGVFRRSNLARPFDGWARRWGYGSGDRKIVLDANTF